MYKKLSIKSKDFFTRLILSYLVVSIAAVSLTAYVISRNFTQSYTDEIDAINHRVISYINMLINDRVLKSVNSIYTTISDTSTTNSSLKNFFSGNYSQVDVVSIYQLTNQLIADNSDIIFAIHFYSPKTQDIISSQYGYKTPGNMSINRDFVEYSEGLKNSRWIPTRPIAENLADYSQSMYLSKLFNIDDNILVVDIREDILYNLVSNLIPRNYTAPIIVNNQKIILSGKDKTKLGTKTDECFSRVFLSDEFGSYQTDIDGQTNIVSFSSIPSSDWKIVLTAETKNFYPSLKKTMLFSILIALLSIALSLIIAYVFSHKLSAPIKKLTAEFDKNSNPGDVDSVVDNIFSRFSELNDTVSKNKNIIRGNFIICSFYNSFTGKTDLESRSKILRHEFDYPYYLPVIINLSIPEENIDEMATAPIVINSLLEDYSDESYIHAETGGSKISMLVGLDNAMGKDSVIEFIDSLLKKFASYTTFYIGSVIDSPEKLVNSFAQMRVLDEFRFFYPDIHIMHTEDFLPKTAKEPPEFTKKLMLTDMTEENYCTEIDSYIHSLLESGLSPAGMQSEILKVFHGISTHIKEMPLSPQIPKDICFCSNIEEFRTAVKTEVNPIC